MHNYLIFIIARWLTVKWLRNIVPYFSQIWCIFVNNSDQTWFFNTLIFARFLGPSVYNISVGTWQMLMHEKTFLNATMFCLIVKPNSHSDPMKQTLGFFLHMQTWCGQWLSRHHSEIITSLLATAFVVWSIWHMQVSLITNVAVSHILLFMRFWVVAKI